MEWTKEQREQAARVILQREHELWPLLQRGEQGPYILYVLRNRTNEVNLQCELTDCKAEAQRLRSQLAKDDVLMGELAVGKAQDAAEAGADFFRDRPPYYGAGLAIIRGAIVAVRAMAKCNASARSYETTAVNLETALSWLQPLPAPPSGEQAATNVGRED